MKSPNFWHKISGHLSCCRNENRNVRNVDSITGEWASGQRWSTATGKAFVGQWAVMWIRLNFIIEERFMHDGEDQRKFTVKPFISGDKSISKTWVPYSWNRWLMNAQQKRELSIVGISLHFCFWAILVLQMLASAICFRNLMNNIFMRFFPWTNLFM